MQGVGRSQSKTFVPSVPHLAPHEEPLIQPRGVGRGLAICTREVGAGLGGGGGEPGRNASPFM